MPNSIRCPKCGAEIPLTDVIEHQIDEQLRSRLSEELAQTEAEHAEALQTLEAKLRQQSAEEAEKRETALKERAQAGVATELADLQAQIDEQAQQLKAARGQELVLRQQKRQLEEAQEALELEVARRIGEERAKIAAQAVERLNEDHHLKLAEKDLQLEQMKDQIKALQESAEQMRAGLKGEALERDIEDVLRERFPQDRIEPIKTGVRGADVLQVVRSASGEECGSILWESKRTKSWSNGWIPKLKEDQARTKADFAVLVSTTLPANIQFMEQYQGVWVSACGCTCAIAIALRDGLLQLAHLHDIDANRTEALDALYSYLSGREFKQRMIAAVETFIAMQADLETEKRSAERAWAKRTKQLERVALSVAGMYGDLQGIMGPALAPVELLELPPASHN
jgi:hypothetical protein